MASNIANIAKIPELRRRVIFTLALLAIYRIGVFITVPGVDRQVMKNIMRASSGSFLGLFNMFSGGALEQLSIFALGIMPYISASIILQLLTVVIPALDQLQKEGEQGRRKINQYTRYGTIGLSLVQGFFIARWLEGSGSGGFAQFGSVVLNPGLGFDLMTMLTLTTGTAFIMWLGEQITERGIGNGISLIIFAGIVAQFPDAMVRLFQKSATQGDLTVFELFLIGGIVVGVIAAIIFFERGQFRIPVQYAKRVVGRKIYGGQSTHLPLKINVAGVIPPIFASSILLFPAQIAGFVQSSWMQRAADVLNPGDWRYNVLYVALIIFFCYFYTAVTFNPVDVADNLKKYGGFIPGIRPGKKTAEYIDRVLTRLTFGGALYISAVCVLPTIMQQKFKVPFYFGGTSLLIVVGVALDTVQQIESHLITRNYDSVIGPKGPRIRGRSTRPR
ncbi:MAG: preprotein translocase subunit SecY [Myxococcales bacterium]|nr:preprotein translocase subunit SecY [Myxococcota bacterium]MDW8282170.1 preprotein translocase subunit SecY [Myxococcales bacterium]